MGNREIVFWDWAMKLRLESGLGLGGICGQPDLEALRTSPAISDTEYAAKRARIISGI